MAKSQNAEEPGLEVVRWYTRARRFPQLIGKTPTGGSIWGGPYTYTQLIVGVVVFVVGLQTTSLWGHFGLIGNALVLLGVSYGVVLVVGKLPIGSRNPLSIGAGALRALGAPAQGRLGGAPFRLRRPHAARSRLVITHTAPAPVAPIKAVEPSEVAEAPTRRRSRRRARREVEVRPVVLPSPLRPTPASSRTHQTPALTGVQRLLASTGTPRQED